MIPSLWVNKKSIKTDNYLQIGFPFSQIKEDRILSNKNGYSQIATIPESKVDKIRLTNDQIKQFNNLALQLNNGSIKMEEAILQLRGGEELTDVIAVIAFVIFVNWYNSLFGGKAFQVNP